jgi:small nuclear ribonucleoprotein E
MNARGGGGAGKVQKVMVQPINLIFRYLQNRSRIQIWLYENVNNRIEGYIVGSFSRLCY